MSKERSELERARLLKEGLAKAGRLCEILLECRERHEQAIGKQRKAA